MTASIEAETELPRFPKDVLSLGELGPTEFEALIELSENFRSGLGKRTPGHQIPGASLALIFEKPSTRTRVSFEVGMFELGGHAVVLSSRDMQLSRGETLGDTARALSQYCDAIAARVISHEALVGLSTNSAVPVINALSDLYHPCQTLADVQTIREFKGDLRGVKLAWVGDGNNVCNSLLIGSALSGMKMSVASPPKYSPLPEALELAKSKSKETGAEIEVVENPIEAVYDSDVVVTDTFVSMGMEEEKKERIETFLPDYQVNEKLMSHAKQDAIFMHCLPAHRGEEVTSSVIDGPRSVVWQEAQNRLHSQKALLFALMRQRSRNAHEDKKYL